jgi:hypothetical protein
VPSSNVLEIAGQNQGASTEGYDGDVPVDRRSGGRDIRRG